LSSADRCKPATVAGQHRSLGKNCLLSSALAARAIYAARALIKYRVADPRRRVLRSDRRIYHFIVRRPKALHRARPSSTRRPRGPARGARRKVALNEKGLNGAAQQPCPEGLQSAERMLWPRANLARAFSIAARPRGPCGLGGFPSHTISLQLS